VAYGGMTHPVYFFCWGGSSIHHHPTFHLEKPNAPGIIWFVLVFVDLLTR